MTGVAQGRTWNGWRIAGWGLAGALLLAPLVAMQFTTEVVWGPFDFAIAAALLLGVGVSFELLARMGGWSYRAGAAVALLTALLLIWVNLAVGFIGEEFNPLNLMFAGVLAVGLFGAVLSSFRPIGMAKAMFAAAAAQVAAGAVAVMVDSPREMAIATAVFALAWALSGGLFLKAAKDPR